MDLNIKKDLASNWFKLLQDAFCNDISILENNKTKKVDYIKSTLKIVDENKLVNTILDKYEAN